ncbi:large-conductance mechanosensitive channel [Phycisphaerae bacterium]|nr:large-conductance mechanosensitive channel [Phycisphaerae bacterium]
MGLISEFKEFALKGNFLDLAIGVIIGGAFGGIVTSMINDIIMPVVGMAGNVNFKDSYIPLSKSAKSAVDAFKAANPDGALPLAEAQKAGAVMAYGNFITIIVNFIILAFILFMVIKAYNTAKTRFEAAKPAAAPAGPTKDQQLLADILAEMKKR